MFKRILIIAGIVISIAVLLISVIAIGWLWTGGYGLTTSIVRLIEGTQLVLETSQRGLTLVSDTLTNVSEVITTVSDTIDQVNQGVKDEGAIMSILPQDRKDQVNGLFDSAGNLVSTIQGTLQGISDTMDAINSIPFVNIQVLDTQQVEKLTASVTEIKIAFDSVQTAVDEFNQGVSTKLTNLSSVVTTLNDKNLAIQSEIDLLNKQVSTIHKLLDSVKAALPIGFVIFAGVSTILIVWVCLSQIFMVRYLTDQYRASREPANDEPEEIKEPVEEISSSEEEDQKESTEEVEE